MVQGEIAGGNAVITGSANFDEARLAQDLNTGAIPAPIFLSGQRTVEATLGADALRTSMQAAAVGIVLLMLYMLLIYRLLGVLANISLALYAILFFVLMKIPSSFSRASTWCSRSPAWRVSFSVPAWPWTRTSSSLSASKKN